jgi:hypothetical protein
MQRDLGEQVQLLFYGLLCQSEAEQQNFSLNAGYLSAQESSSALTVFEALEDDRWFLETLQAEKRRIETVWMGLSQGTVLRAQGTTEACRYCAMRGLCRRDERETPQRAGESAL